MIRGTFQLMKSVNKSLILNKIRKGSPISRARIAEETELTPPTVSAIVKELIAEDIVKETNLGKSSGGRKPTMLEINAAAFNIIGVDAGPDRIDIAVTDLAGQISYSAKLLIREKITQQNYLDDLIQIIRNTLPYCLPQEKILGIGVAMHGVVDTSTGVSLIAPNLGLKNMPIKEVLEDTFNIETIVENDARTMALGESWFGGYLEEDNMMTVNIGNGVGAGLVVNGSLYHGADDIAGEIGHMTIDIHGAKCDCGNQGCLQALVSGQAIAKRANQLLGQDTFDSGEAVYEAAIKGNEKLKHLFLEIGEIIGIGLTNVIHIANPGLIIIGGGVSNAENLFLDKTRQTIHERALTDSAKRTRVMISKLDDKATVLGAVALILVAVFE